MWFWKSTNKKYGFGNQQIKNINHEEDYTGEFYNNLRHGQGTT